MKEVIGSNGLVVPDGETHLLKVKNGRAFWERYQHDRLFEALKYVRKADGTPRTAVDVGAHVGLLSRAMVEHFDSVVAFEPDPEAFACLVENVRGLPVEAIRKALGDRAGYVGLDVVTDGNTGNRQVDPAGAGVEMTRLDDVSFQHRVDLLKLDVQGYEPFVIDGATETLKTFRPVVILEDEPRGKLRRNFQRPGRALELLRRLGYEHAARVGDDVILVPGGKGAP